MDNTHTFTQSEIVLYQPKPMVDMFWLNSWITLLRSTPQYLSINKEIAIRTLHAAKEFLETQIKQLTDDLRTIERTIQIME